MAPQIKPEWVGDISLGNTSDLPISYNQKVKKMIVREIPSSEKRPGYQLNWPLIITIEKEDGRFFAQNEELDLFAEGENETKCLANFYEIFEEMKTHYLNLEESRAMGLALKLKSLFVGITR